MQSTTLGKVEEFLAEKFNISAALITIAVTIGIVIILSIGAFRFFSDVSVIAFLSGFQWTPFFEPRQFGVLPLIYGTVMIAVISSLISLPCGLGIAIFLNEIAPGKVRKVVKPVLEILAGIPTVVYGWFALNSITPIIKGIFPQLEVFNALSAGIVVGIMTLPMVASLCDDAFVAVPDATRNAARATGATEVEIATRIVVPAAMGGILASFLLAFSRAIGETMAVTLAAGSTPTFGATPLESIQTMTAFIVQASLGDAAHGTIEYHSIFAVAATLFIVTLLFNFLIAKVSGKFRKDYAS